MLRKCCAYIGSGHSFIIENKFLAQYFDERMNTIPIEVFIDNEFRCYLIDSVKSGAKINTINNIPSEKFIPEIMQIMSRDGNASNGNRLRLTHRLGFYFPLIYGESNEYHLGIELPDGKKKSLIISSNKLKNNQVNTPLIELSFIDSLNSAYLRIGSFGPAELAAQKIDFSKSLAKMMMNISNSEVKNLIIDVRGNNGGKAPYCAELISYLYNKPFNFFDYIGYKQNKKKDYYQFLAQKDWLNHDKLIGDFNSKTGLYHYKYDKKSTKLYTQYPPNKLQINANIYFLMDGISYSATGSLLSVCKYYNIGTLIGEPSDGDHLVYTASFPLKLPNTGFTAMVPRSEISMNLPGYEYTGNGLKPDHLVYYEYLDRTGDIDSQLLYTYELIKQSLTKPKTK